jgi:hypothetical protein
MSISFKKIGEMYDIRDDHWDSYCSHYDVFGEPERHVGRFEKEEKINMKAVVFVLALILPAFMAATEQCEGKSQEPGTLYRTKCSSCHRVYPLKEHTYQVLKEDVATYGKGLNDDERQKLLEYLKENAKQEPVEGGAMADK